MSEPGDFGTIFGDAPPGALVDRGWRWHPIRTYPRERFPSWHLIPPTIRAKHRAACGAPLNVGRWPYRPIPGEPRVYCELCLERNQAP